MFSERDQTHYAVCRLTKNEEVQKVGKQSYERDASNVCAGKDSWESWWPEVKQRSISDNDDDDSENLDE